MNATITRDMTIEEFCDRHGACAEGRAWALANCTSMRDAWDKLKPEWLIWVATRPGVLTDKDLWLFAVHCARSVEHLMTDQRSKNAISVAERHINGEATDAELAAAGAAARAAAGDAAGDAAWGAARGAAGAAAWGAARGAAWGAAWGAARGAAGDAAGAAVWAAARAAAWAAAWAGFCQHLRRTVAPCFEVKS